MAFPTFTGEVQADESEFAHLVRGVVTVANGEDFVKVNVPVNEAAPKAGTKIKVAYETEPCLGGEKITRAWIVKDAPKDAPKAATKDDK
jgi:hypothetical protein